MIETKIDLKEYRYIILYIMNATTIIKALNQTFDEHVGGIIFSFLSHPTSDIIRAHFEYCKIAIAAGSHGSSVGVGVATVGVTIRIANQCIMDRSLLS